MKNSIRMRAILALSIIAIAFDASAQLNVPSDGSDGALNITTNTVIDLSLATTGVWSQDNSTNAGNGVYDGGKWAVVFKYSSINIAANVAVRFLNHPTHAPVVWLVQSNATIAGNVILDGGFLVTANPAHLAPTEPGPGGFRGGALGAAGGGAGYGPGGINGGSGVASAYGSGYGNPQALPLMGGSGCGANTWGGNYGPFAGPSGAGAILIAAGSAVTVDGQISAGGPGAQFGASYEYTYSGGGAIRIIGNQILGSGSLNAGVVRTEANSVSPQLVITPNTIAVTPGRSPTIWPASNTPVVTIVRVDSASTPTDPLAGVLTSSDVNISTNNPVDIILQANNFPPSGAITVRVTPKYANYWNVGATYVSGDFSASTWKATTTFPNGFCVLQAHATSP